MSATTTRTAAPQLPSHLAMVRRICRAFRAASAEHLAQGLAWYDTAADFCANLDARNPERAAGVFAALSPRCQVSTNMAWAETVIAAADKGQRHAPAVHTRTMRGQAWRIALGAPALAVLNGPKVRAFYANITGDTQAVTVDVWATLVATGSKDDRLIGTPGRYARVAAAYVAAAARLSTTTGATVTPRDVQAATWMHASTLYGQRRARTVTRPARTAAVRTAARRAA